MNDYVLKPKAPVASISVLPNDTVHSSENFEHSTTLTVSGNSGSRFFYRDNPEDVYYWFQEISGSGSLTTHEDGAESEVTLEGFAFRMDIGERGYYSEEGCAALEADPPEFHDSATMQWGLWSGGTVTIENEYGITVIEDVYFIGGLIIDPNPPIGEFGQGTGFFVNDGWSFQMALPVFDGFQEEQTIDGNGLLELNAPPQISVTVKPEYGDVQIAAGGNMVYTPDAGSEGVDDFEYTIMTQLGDKDSAIVRIGTMDLDVSDLTGRELSESAEDQPGLFLGVNNDDDDENGKADLLDTGFVDNDLAKLQIKERAPTGIDISGGYFTVSFENKVKLWHSNDKKKPSNHNAAEVISGITRFAIDDSSEDFVLWVEGASWGATTIALHWTNGSLSRFFDAVTVTVVGLDFDIDSNNDDGFSLPRRDDWEEYLEDNEYGIGKMLTNVDFQFTPTVVSLPAGLDNSPTSPLHIRFDFKPIGKSGVIKVWNTNKANVRRIDKDITEGGNRVLPGQNYRLNQLGYDPVTGSSTVWLDAFFVFDGHSTKKGIEDFGKPDDRIKASLIVAEQSIVHDQVKYMVVIPNTFYPNLQTREEMRNAIASHKVYSQAGDEKYSMKLLSKNELRALNVPAQVIDLIGTPSSIPGFKSAIYWDHVSGKYVLAFAGTDDSADVMVDIWQGLGVFTLQYRSALEIGRLLALIDAFQENTVTTGHSLGGGLASAASIASGFSSDTFNSAGLLENILEQDDQGNPIPGDPVELFRYANASTLRV